MAVKFENNEREITVRLSSGDFQNWIRTIEAMDILENDKRDIISRLEIEYLPAKQQEVQAKVRSILEQNR